MISRYRYPFVASFLPLFILVSFSYSGTLVTTGAGASAEEPAPQPNIIHVFADDLGYGDTGPYGTQIIRTPNIDAMADQGMKFTQHYTSAPVCLPARSCLMSGLHQGHTFARYNQDKNKPMPAEVVSLAEHLKQAGYATGGFGKWSIGEIDTPGNPMDQGFDRFFGYLNQSAASDYYPEQLDDDRGIRELPENRDGQQGAYSHDLIVQEALEFIEAHKDERFYVYLPITPPHTDFVVPEDEIIQYYRETLPTLPDGDKFKEKDMVYAAMVERIDRDMGRILALLAQLGLSENTLVVFDSDNGPAFPGMANRLNSTAGLKGNKRNLWEGGIRSPLIVRWPAAVEAGAVCDQPTVAYDWLATFADLAGVDVQGPTDGRSIVPLMKGGALPERPIYWEFVAVRNSDDPTRYQQAARKGWWKVFRTKSAEPEQLHEPTQLYDLQNDPGETTNVAADHPEIVAELEAFMDANASEDHLP